MSTPADIPSGQPRPLRVLASIGGLISLIVGALPTMGVHLSTGAAGWIVGVVGALSSVAVALIGETQVTPVSAPRANDGTPLVPATGPTQP